MTESHADPAPNCATVEAGPAAAGLSAADRAAETLQRLLEAEDLPLAVEQLAGQLDAELLALIRSNAAAARADNNADLAEGLENLAAYIAERVPPPAPQPPSAEPAEYYSFARPEVARLVPATARRVLDVGCGAGLLGASLKARGNTEVMGLEINPTAAAAAAQRLDRVFTADLNALESLPLPDGYFDCLVFADVLEHLAEPAQVLLKLKRYLDPAGAVVISLPNVRHYSVTYDLLVNGLWTYAPAGILDRTHLRFFTWESVQALLHEVGLRGEMAEPVLTAYHPLMDGLLKVVAEVGGNVDQARLELQTYQFVFRARPTGRLEPPADKPRAAAALASIIILTLNNLELTRPCLESIAAGTTPGTYELIIVDNGSTDGTVDFLRTYAAERPHVKVVANSKNCGFAGGNNQGLALAQGDYVVFLNNDTLVSHGWLDRMLAVFRQEPAVGLVGPMSNWVSGPQRVSTVTYTTPAEMQLFAERWAMAHAGQTQPAGRLVGFCLMVSRRVVDAIGGFDPSFVIGNFEDDDFCVRAAYAGFGARMALAVFIHHVGNQTFKNANLNFTQNMLRNGEIFKAKWRLPPELDLAHGYRIPVSPPPKAVQPIPLPDLKVDHEPALDGRWWAAKAGERKNVSPTA